ncbi:EEF1A lysine methyltransferase 1 [Lobulomyces angularis]|nr:EEF1A lysine methyltransferase 1 [Lobulomyces angularis]
MQNEQFHSDSDSDLELSSHALNALKEYMKEQEVLEAKFAELKTSAEVNFEVLNMKNFKEDFQLSQFWYSDGCALDIVNEAISNTEDGDFIACLSSPSVYLAFKKLNPLCNRKFVIFEVDERFNVFKEEFQQYDLYEPLNFDVKYKHAFKYLVVDPPFLSEECFSKVKLTVDSLKFDSNTKILINTGQIMQQFVKRNFNCNLTKYQIEHSCGLANEFQCSINYESKDPKFALEL